MRSEGTSRIALRAWTITLALLLSVGGLGGTARADHTNVYQARASGWWLDGYEHPPIATFYPGELIGYWGLYSSNDPSFQKTLILNWHIEGPCNYVQDYNLLAAANGYGWAGWQGYLPVNACPGLYTYTFNLSHTKTGGTGSASTTFTVAPDAPPDGVPTIQTLGQCLRSSHAARPTDCLADPVNMATGNFVRQEIDATIPGVGLSFEFSRSYNSIDATSGVFGPGWTFSYNAALLIQPNGDAVFRAEDGQALLFTKQGDGTFIAAAGGRSKLSAAAGGYELTRPDGARYGFDATGRSISLLDRNGNTMTLSYSNGKLASITDTVGRIITFTHNGSGQLTMMALPDGRSVSYGYAAGRLSTVTNQSGGITTYGYDAGGRLSSITDAAGRLALRNTYGSNGRVTEQLDARGKLTTFGWDPATETATMTDPRGSVTTEVYSKNVLIRSIDPLGNVTRYSWDDDLNMRRVSHPIGGGRWDATVSYRYDSRGNMIYKFAPPPFGYEERFNYDDFGNVVSSSDRKGRWTYMDYDATGNLISSSKPGGVVTQFGRNARGQLISLTDPRGKVTTFAYDAQGNQTRVTSPLGAVTTSTYDSMGRMLSKVEPRGNVTGADPTDYRWTFSYDEVGHQTGQTDPLGNTWTTTYDAVGNLISRKDALNRTTTMAYDAANHLISVTTPDLSTTQNTYDDAGNLISRTDAKGRVTTYTYDAKNRLTSTTKPLGRKWSFTYDANDNRRTITDPAGNATPSVATDGMTTLSYDEMNRLTGITYSDGTPSIAYQYDAVNNRTRMTDGAGTQNYVYDATDHVTSITRGTDVFTYTWDLAGNLTQRKYPDGTTFDHAYDDDGRPTTLTTGGTVTSYGYDVAGNQISRTLPSANGYVETRTYDRAGRLTEVRNKKGTTTLSFATVSRDPIGNPTSITTQAETATFTYDARDRLTQVCYTPTCLGSGTPFIRWTHDAVGNRLTETRTAGTTTYSYDDADQLTQRTGVGGTVAYTYDASGNTTAEGSTIFTYDLVGRLKTSKIGSTTTTYAYDGDGNRLSASAGGGPSSTTKYVWDSVAPLPQLAMERNGNNALLRRYAYGTGLESMTAGSSTYQFLFDQQGSVTNVTSSAGVNQWSYSYDPFGNVRSEVKANAKAPTNVMRFTGQLLDGTGLYHLRTRQYSPVTGRFLHVDPKAASAEVPSISAYVYADQRPTVFTDPSGEDVYGTCQSFSLGGLGKVIGGVWQFITGKSASWGSRTGSICHVWSDAGQEGITVATGKQIGLGGSAFPTVQITNIFSDADDIHDMAGPFGNLGGSAGTPLGGIAGDIFFGQGHCNQLVTVGSLGVQFGPSTPEVHMGYSKTRVISAEAATPCWK